MNGTYHIPVIFARAHHVATCVLWVVGSAYFGVMCLCISHDAATGRWDVNLILKFVAFQISSRTHSHTHKNCAHILKKQKQKRYRYQTIRCTIWNHLYVIDDECGGSSTNEPELMKSVCMTIDRKEHGHWQRVYYSVSLNGSEHASDCIGNERLKLSAWAWKRWLSVSHLEHEAATPNSNSDATHYTRYDKRESQRQNSHFESCLMFLVPLQGIHGIGRFLRVAPKTAKAPLVPLPEKGKNHTTSTV